MKTLKPPSARPNAISLGDEEAVRQAARPRSLACGTSSTTSPGSHPSRRDRYRVTIFGSARVQPGTFGYEEPSVWPPRSPDWVATSSPAAAPG